MTLLEGPVVAVGKIAGEAEFLRAETKSGAVFDDWLDESFEAALEHWGGDSRSALRGGSPHAFVWWPRGAERFDGPLCGVLAPSRDAVGRDYPLAVFARVEAAVATSAPHVLLLALGEFLDEAWRVIDVARNTPMSRSEFARRLRELPRPCNDQVERAMTDYAEWCRTVRFRDGWNAVVETGEGPMHSHDVVSAIMRRDADGLLRLPVGSGGAGAVALWLDIAARILGRREASHSAFWSADRRSLVVALNTPSTSIVEALWGPEVSAHASAPSEPEPERDNASPVGTDLSMAEFLASLA